MAARLKVSLFTKYNGDACEYVRVTAPCRIMGAELTAFHGEDEVSEQAIADSDLVIFQRTYPSLVENYQNVIKFAKRHNKPIVFEIDDYLFDLPEEHPDRESGAYVSDLLPMLGALSDADCVTVPTTTLKEKLAPFNQNIIVVPNYIDDQLWQYSEGIEQTVKWLEPAKSSDFFVPANRPMVSILDCDKLEDYFSLILPSRKSELATELGE